MTQTHTPMSSSANEILQKITQIEWKQDGNEGEPPIPTPDDLIEIKNDNITTEVWKNFDQVWKELDKREQELQEELNKMGMESTQNEMNQKQQRDLYHTCKFRLFMGYKDLPEDSETGILRIHEGWQLARKSNTKLKHPLAPIVRAWVMEHIPKVVPERCKHQGIMPHKIRDSFPAVESQGEGVDVGNLPQGGKEIQGVLPGFDFPESEIVPALPLVAYDAAGGKTKSGRGASIDQRLFVNLLIEYPKHECSGVARIGTTYRDIRGWLYPNGTRESKKTLIPKLQEGFKNLHNLWFEWERRAWNIIAVDALPTIHTKPDDPLSFTIRFPEGMNTGGGASIGLDALRTYGAQSAPKFRAWVRLAYLWDAAKIKNGGKRIYATIPEVLRDSDGHITDAKGQKILTGELYNTKNGWQFRAGNLPQTAWYHPLASSTRRQIRNPQADKVPILDDADMVKLFYDHDKRKGEAFWKALHDARQRAKGMENDGYIVVEQDAIDQRTGKRGWRILEARTGNITKLSNW